MGRKISIFRGLGIAAFMVGLVLGLSGCVQLFGPSEVGPIAVLEAYTLSVAAGEPMKFYVSAQAGEGRKIEFYWVSFGDGESFSCEPMAVVSVEREEVTHTYSLPEGTFEKTYYVTLYVYDDAGNRGKDSLEITVWRPEAEE